MSSPHLSLIVPAYNEAKSIAHTLERMQAYLDGRGRSYEIIVAADGDDGTRDIAGAVRERDDRVRVIGRPGRHGKGKGIREGVAIARGAIIGFLDADYKVVIEESERLLPWLDQGYDLVIGSRAMPDSEIAKAQPLHRRLGSKAFAVGMRLVTGLGNVRDTQCGFKFFHAAIARDLFARQRIDGYMFDVEILYLARQAGYRLKEVGVRWQDDGDSRLELFAGNWRNFLDVLRVRWGAYPPAPTATEPIQQRHAA